MSILSADSIKELIKKGTLQIKPLGENAINGIDINLRLGNKFSTLIQSGKQFIDPLHRKTPRKPSDFLDTEPAIVSKKTYTLLDIENGEKLLIEPGEFVIGQTKEQVTIPSTHVGMLHGRSSLGRLGVQVFCSGGFVDPGFNGYLLLEIYNANQVPIALYPGMNIAKLALQEISVPVKVNKPLEVYTPEGINKLSSWMGESIGSKHNESDSVNGK